MKKVLLLSLLVCVVCAAKDKKPVEWIAGTLLDVSSERGFDVDSIRNDVTYYTIDDGKQYIYVFKRTLRKRWDKELLVTVNAPVKFAIVGDNDFLLMDDKGEEHKVSLQKRSLRPAK